MATISTAQTPPTLLPTLPMIALLILLTPILLFTSPAQGFSSSCGDGDLLRDLLIVEEIDAKLQERMPVYYNNLLQGGYWNMPSARMGREGELGAGFSYVKPYYNYNLRAQLFSRIEVSGNYRVFRGIEDPILSPLGFGDKSDKGANIKLAILLPEESHYALPGIAVGYEDCMGTKGFWAKYIVATQVMPKWNLECSVGYGEKRIGRWFGGASWMPFYGITPSFWRTAAFSFEYDATRYRSCKREPHPHARSQRTHINYGVKLRLFDHFDLALSHNKGEQLSCSLSATFNPGNSAGLLTKFDNPLPYLVEHSYRDAEEQPLTEELVKELRTAFCHQGLKITKVTTREGCNGKAQLKIYVENCQYRYELELREQLDSLLAGLIPASYERVAIVLQDLELPLQTYCYSTTFLHRFAKRNISPYELEVLTPVENVTPQNCCEKNDFSADKSRFALYLEPKSNAIFGSARGKFKYAVGLELIATGFLWRDILYEAALGYNIFSDLYDIKDVDRLNPSQLINVRTDIINYYKQKGITVDQLYMQKMWNLSKGWFMRGSAGLFEVAYGGAACELLYYPTGSQWAVGIEGAYLRKRKYSGVRFTNKIRKLEGYCPTYLRFTGSQYFLNYYYQFRGMGLDLQLQAGKFLANDWGLKTIVTRNYSSGMSLYCWYTYTNKRDYINGKRYFDKGVGIALPFDLFYTRSCRKYWHYGLSAWLRDVGAEAYTGIPLFPLIESNRREK